MPDKFIEVELDNDQKAAILKYAGFFVTNTITKEDLENKRKRLIRFKPSMLEDVIGELSYHFNRAKSDSLFYFLDELILHLESYE